MSLADPFFERARAHRRQCATCQKAKSPVDEAMCRVGAALMLAWLNAEVRFGSPTIRRVEDGRAS